MNIGNIVECVAEKSTNFGCRGVITDVAGDKVYIKYNSGEVGSGKSKYYKLITLGESISPKKGIMSSITEFAKNLVLSADEKLMRKYGLKDSCGNYSADAREIVMQKLMSENEEVLVDLAKAKEEDDKE